MTVILDRDGGDLDRTRRLGWARFERAVRREITRRGGQKPSPADRPQPLRRPGRPGRGDRAPSAAHSNGSRWCWRTGPSTSTAWPRPRRRMVSVLDELELTSWSPRSTASAPVGAAAILAETGDPHRFATARAMVKHAGLAPREKTSGTFTGRTKLTGQGRPRLRVAAWRAVWGSLQTNTVYAARYRHLTSREHNKLTPTQAQTVIAAAILRHLHAVITTGQAWDPHDRHRRHQDDGDDTCRRLTHPVEAASQS